MQLSTTSLLASSAGSSPRPCALAPKRAASERGGARRRAVRDARHCESALHQRIQRELDHLAGADKQRRFVGQRLEDLLGQLHGDARNRNGAIRDCGLVAHALRGAESALVEARQNRATGAAGDGRAVGVLHLAENLRLADHLRIRRARHAKQVLHCGGIVQLVERALEFGCARRLLRCEFALEERAHPHARGFEIPRCHQHLDAIAGREHHRLVDLGAAHELRERGRRIVDGVALAQIERGAAMAEAEQ